MQFCIRGDDNVILCDVSCVYKTNVVYVTFGDLLDCHQENEFDAFENPTNASKGAGTGGGPKRRNASQIEELEQEMKLLHWHKLANVLCKAFPQ